MKENAKDAEDEDAVETAKEGINAVENGRPIKASKKIAQLQAEGY